MKTEKLIITIMATDGPGVVQRLSDVVLENKGNWAESRLSHLCGQFAGIVHIEVAPEERAALLSGLAALESEAIHVTQHGDSAAVGEVAVSETVTVSVEANDRPGIVEEIASALADAEVNVERMSTSCHSASMAGYSLFDAEIVVALPEGFSVQKLEDVLEDVSDDLITNIEIG